MSTLGVGVIGAGWVAGEYIRAAASDPGTKLVGIYARTERSARDKAVECGVKCDIFTDLGKMLALPEIDIVVVATPPICHKEHAVAAAQAGKHLVLEKAMANTLEEARTIRDAVAKAGVKSVVSFVLRWNPLFEIIKTQLADNAIGSVFLGEVDYFHGIGPWYKQFAWSSKKETGGSSLLSAGCHAMDALRWFMGDDIVEVFQYSGGGKFGELAAYEFDPTSVTLCKFAGGRMGKVASCVECIQPYVFNINLVGTQGTIRNNQLYSKPKFPGQTGWAQIPTILPDSGDVTHHPFQIELHHLVDCIASGKESHCSVADAYKTHEVCFAADLSGKEGRPVRLPLP